MRFGTKEIRKDLSRVMKNESFIMEFIKEPEGGRKMSYILQTDHLGKTMEGKELVSDVNIHIKKGEIYGFLGPNGAGKTTVMRMITNLWKPTSGTITLFGRTLGPDSYEVLKRMGSIIEFPAFYENLSGRENLQLHCEYMGYYNKGAVEEAMGLLDLAGAAGRPVKQYSLGMKQRLGIARAILCRPELVILDEPANGLDPAGMKQIRELFRTLCGEYGMTFMISSHLLSEIESMADMIGVISHGRMIQEISMRQIAERNTEYVELMVEDRKRAAFVLSDRLQINNFKLVDNRKIRIYETDAETQRIARGLMENKVELLSISRHTETLEEYFLKMTSEGEKIC